MYKFKYKFIYISISIYPSPVIITHLAQHLRVVLDGRLRLLRQHGRYRRGGCCEQSMVGVYKI